MIPHNVRGVNIDLSARCTLECPMCSRTKLKKQGLKVPGEDVTFEQFKKIADYFNYINFCGQVSDPSMNHDFIKMLRYLEEGHKVSIHVAASHRREKWWNEAFDANSKARWVFGIDGLPKDSHNYRKNQDGQKLFDMMLLAKSKGLNCVWQYIVFNYNENDIEEARAIARKHDIRFDLLVTSRFTPDDPLLPKNKKFVMSRPGIRTHAKEDI